MGTPPAPGLDLEHVLHLQGARVVAGVDEVGRGSWAGPVVAAAVVISAEDYCGDELAGARDSKLLTAEERLSLFPLILAHARVGLGFSSHHTIDSKGLAAANRAAVLRAIQALRIEPDALLLDAMRLPELPVTQLFLPKCDSLSLSVACASIVAKVVRDRWMEGCDSRFPGYGFAEHKGYGTRRHGEALRRLGPCPLHRRSFAPVAAVS